MKDYREQETGSLICPSNFALSSADAQFMSAMALALGVVVDITSALWTWPRSYSMQKNDAA